MPTIIDYLKYANLQMAAEALYAFDATKSNALTPGATDRYDSESVIAGYLKSGNNHASRFTETEAKKFSENWEVVEHISNTKTGFSGTLFRSKSDPNNLVISIRSTEFIDDAARDSKATNELEIKEKGFAFGQLADMEDWYASLKATNELENKNTGFAWGQMQSGGR